MEMDSVSMIAKVSRPGMKDAIEVSRNISGKFNVVRHLITPGKVFFTIHFENKNQFTSTICSELSKTRLVESIHLVIIQEKMPIDILKNIHQPEILNQFEKEIKNIINSQIFETSLTQNIKYCKLLCKKKLEKNQINFKCHSRRVRLGGKTVLSSNLLSKIVGIHIEESYSFLNVSLTNYDINININVIIDDSDKNCREDTNSFLFLLSIPILVHTTKYSHGSWQVGSGGLHPSISWALAKCLPIKPSDIILDPFCGRGNILIETALNWEKKCTFIGCDIDEKQLEAARLNVKSANLTSRISLIHADTAYNIPLLPESVDKIVIDLPFGKKFGSVENNVKLYPKILLEMARVIRGGGIVVLLTSGENERILRSCLAKVWETGSKARTSNDASTNLTNNNDYVDEDSTSTKSSNNLNDLWSVTWKFSFMLFSKIRARVFMLQRTDVKQLPTVDQVVNKCIKANSALVAHEKCRQKKFDGNKNWENNKPTLFVGKLGGKVLSHLPWDTDSKSGSWSQQWKLNRPPMVVWR